MDLYRAAVDILRMSLLLIGSVVILIGFAQASLEAFQNRYTHLAAQQILINVALGLEFL
jgi:hypothetical protein